MKMLKNMLLAVVLVSPSLPALAAQNVESGAKQDVEQVQTDTKPGGPSSAPAASPSPSIDQAYASREAGAKQLENFEGGGNGIYISGGAAAVIILILVLIIVF